MKLVSNTINSVLGGPSKHYWLGSPPIHSYNSSYVWGIMRFAMEEFRNIERCMKLLKIKI